MKDDALFIITILYSISQRHPWKNILPSECCCNSWIISIDEEDPITVGDVIDTLNYFRKNGKTEVVMQLHERTSYNGTLLNECRYLFDQFEHPRLSEAINNESTIPSHTNQSQPVSSRTRNKLSQS